MVHECQTPSIFNNGHYLAWFLNVVDDNVTMLLITLLNFNSDKIVHDAWPRIATLVVDEIYCLIF